MCSKRSISTQNNSVLKSDKEGDRPQLPILPRGMGSMQWRGENVIIYRKYIDGGGRKIQISVQGKTLSEVMKLMRAKEYARQGN